MVVSVTVIPPVASGGDTCTELLVVEVEFNGTKPLVGLVQVPFDGDGDSVGLWVLKVISGKAVGV